MMSDGGERGRDRRGDGDLGRILLERGRGVYAPEHMSQHVTSVLTIILRHDTAGLCGLWRVFVHAGLTMTEQLPLVEEMPQVNSVWRFKAASWLFAAEEEHSATCFKWCTNTGRLPPAFCPLLGQRMLNSIKSPFTSGTG